MNTLDALKSSHKLLATGHVLRYSPFYLLMKRLVSEGHVGQIQQVLHTERVGWWHFAHSYVRGNWRSSGADEDGRANGHGAPSFLTKCCHDVDFVLWLLDGRHLTAVQQATRMYLDALPARLEHPAWPSTVLVPDIEDVPAAARRDAVAAAPADHDANTGARVQHDSHAGGDEGLARAFVEAMWRVERCGTPVPLAQLDVLGFDAEDLRKAYLAIWAAERSRTTGRVVCWEDMAV
ncbi:hypothetical protein F4780DRAFT_783833 [Xylariomycetidae sp. FL0641]|nr:hypothetical protein F4780DRAFT_783833 [Xylariomycetidae sp. FL0641]